MTLAAFLLLLLAPPLATAIAARFADVRTTFLTALFALAMFTLINGNLLSQGETGPLVVLLVSLANAVFEAAVCSVAALISRASRGS